MRINANVAVSKSGFVFNAVNGESFSVNYTGSAIMKILSEKNGDESIIQKLHEMFQCDKSTLERDLSDFINQLREYELLDSDDEK